MEGFKIVEEDGEAYAVSKDYVLYMGLLFDRRQFILKTMRVLTGGLR